MFLGVPALPLFASWPAAGCSVTWGSSESTSVLEPRLSGSGGKTRKAPAQIKAKAPAHVPAPSPSVEGWLRNLITTSQAGWWVPRALYLPRAR